MEPKLSLAFTTIDSARSLHDPNVGHELAEALPGRAGDKDPRLQSPAAKLCSRLLADLDLKLLRGQLEQIWLRGAYEMPVYVCVVH